ncbi:unnamed protein product [Prorocentrum cordatum]|uniref:Uncharacterized protein n=1 Tax=Prorocentrum cordatum TaxID=2364126 RepID=A0ABN9VDD0_9DINO|nr:unnamed protein product [Polarella glacialis]
MSVRGVVQKVQKRQCGYGRASSRLAAGRGHPIPGTSFQRASTSAGLALGRLLARAVRQHQLVVDGGLRRRLRVKGSVESASAPRRHGCTQAGSRASSANPRGPMSTVFKKMAVGGRISVFKAAKVYRPGSIAAPSIAKVPLAEALATAKTKVTFLEGQLHGAHGRDGASCDHAARRG